MEPGGCLYNEAHFSTGLSYLVIDCKGPDVPRVLLYQSGNETAMMELNGNEELRTHIKNVSLPKVRMFLVPLRSGYNASVKIIMPEEIGLRTFGSYPLIIHV